MVLRKKTLKFVCLAVFLLVGSYLFTSQALAIPGPNTGPGTGANTNTPSNPANGPTTNTPSNPTSGPTTNTPSNPTNGPTTNTPPAPVGVTIQLTNPLKADNLQCLIYNVVSGVTNILAIVAALFIIYSGFLFVAAQGNPGKLQDARKTLFNALIGTAILLGAWAITTVVVNVVNQVTVSGVPNLPTAASCAATTPTN